MNFSDLIKKIQSAYYKRDGKFVDPYLYDIILNGVKPEVRTKLLMRPDQAAHLKDTYVQLMNTSQQMSSFQINRMFLQQIPSLIKR